MRPTFVFTPPATYVSFVPSRQTTMFLLMEDPPVGWMCGDFTSTHLRERDHVAGTVAENRLRRAVEGLPPRIDDCGAGRQRARHGLEVVDLDEKRRGAERRRPFQHVRLVGADAVA